MEDRPADLDHPYDNFQESLYEHGGPVVAIEKNFKDNSIFATAGKDQKVFIWKLAGEQGKDDAELVTEIGKQQFHKVGGSTLNLGYVTSLKWYDENVLALAFSNGTLQLNDIRIKQGTGESTSACSLLWNSEGGPIWDIDLWRDQSGVKIVTAEDSGNVSLIDPRMASAAPIVLTVSLEISLNDSYSMERANRLSRSALTAFHTVGIKRSCLPQGLNNHSASLICPRLDRQMPIS